MNNMLNNVKIYIKTAPPLYVFCDVLCFGAANPFLITLCEIQTEQRLKTAVWAYTQTTALGWIKEASVTLVA